MDGSIETPLFMAESREKNGKIIMEKKRRKKRKFSLYSVPLFLHIIGSIETPLFMAESGEKSGYFLHSHYKGLLNVEFPWDEGALPDAPPVEGPPPPITNEMVTKALAKMKSGKAAGPSGIIVEMLKATGSKGIVFLRELTKSVVKHGKIPEDWEMSFILNLYKGRVGRFLPPGGRNRIKPRFKPSRKK